MFMQYTITFYVPIEDCEPVKAAMFAAGAGALGNYNQCSWQVLGQGQFQALPGSNPAVGKQQMLTKLDEYRVEMLCEERHIVLVVNALKASHPYEEVAFHITESINI